MFITRSLNVTPKTTEQNLIVRRPTCKYEAEITDNKRCARGTVLLKITADRHKASRGLSAATELLVYPSSWYYYGRFCRGFTTVIAGFIYVSCL